MGRPPIGKAAMTDAERQRRRRERLAAEHATQPREPSAPCAACTEKDDEIERLHRCAAAAETEAATLKRRLEEAQARPAAPSEGAGTRKLLEDLKRATSEIAKLKKQLADAQAVIKTLGVGPEAMRGAAREAREIDRLKEENVKLEALLAADPGEVGQLVKQLKGANTRIKTLRTDLYEARKAAMSKGVAIRKADKRIMWRALHPDSELDPARKKVIEKAAQIYGGLTIYEVD